MNCYLKITHLNRHKKYRFCRDKPINFQQIRRELLVNLPAETLAFAILNKQSAKNEDGEELLELRMSELELSEYLKHLQIQENETIKIKIVEDHSKLKKERSLNVDDDDSQMTVPLAVDRHRSKSEEILMQTAKLEIKTDRIEVTQEFLCNSNFEYVDLSSKQTQTDWIFKELESNARRMKLLKQKMRLTNIPALRKKIKTHLASDLHDHQ